MTRIQKSKNEKCWTLSPKPTNTHSTKHDSEVRVSQTSTIPPVLVGMGKKAGQIKAGQTLGQTNVQTPLLPLSGTRKVVRTPTNPFEAAGTIEVFVPKEIIARRIQQIFAGPNKDRKADHYLVVWEDYPLEKDYTWEPIENLYGHEDLAQTYEQWLKTENERLDSEEAERKTTRKMTTQKVNLAGSPGEVDRAD